MVLTTF